MHEKGKTTGIHIEGGSNNVVSNNYVEGFDQGIVAKNEQGLRAKGNVVIDPSHGVNSIRWFQTVWFKWTASVIGALLTAYLVHKFGWK